MAKPAFSLSSEDATPMTEGKKSQKKTGRNRRNISVLCGKKVDLLF